MTRLTRALTGLTMLLVATGVAPAQSPAPEHVPGEIIGTAGRSRSPMGDR